MRICVVLGISFEHLAVKKTAAKVLMRFVVGDGPFLLCNAISGMRLILALRHIDSWMHSLGVGAMMGVGGWFGSERVGAT